MRACFRQWKRLKKGPRRSPESRPGSLRQGLFSADGQLLQNMCLDWQIRFLIAVLRLADKRFGLGEGFAAVCCPATCKAMRTVRGVKVKVQWLEAGHTLDLCFEEHTQNPTSPTNFLCQSEPMDCHPACNVLPRPKVRQRLANCSRDAAEGKRSWQWGPWAHCFSDMKRPFYGFLAFQKIFQSRRLEDQKLFQSRRFEDQTPLNLPCNAHVQKGSHIDSQRMKT